MSIMETQELKVIERFLDLATVRQSLLVSNIANVDTPGYRTKDIRFHQEMLAALAQDADTPVQPMVEQVSGLIARPDGNNVSADREGLLLAEVQLRYQAGVQAIKSEFAMIHTAIMG